MRDAGLELELAITQDRCLTRLPRYWGAWNDGAGSVSSRRLRCWRRQRRPERICRRSRAGTDYCRPRCTSGAAWLSLGLGRRRNRVIVEATRHRDVDVVFRFAHDSPLEQKRIRTLGPTRVRRPRQPQGSLLTPRWREMDSNPRSPVSGAVTFWAFYVPVVIGQRPDLWFARKNPYRAYQSSFSITVGPREVLQRGVSCELPSQNQANFVAGLLGRVLGSHASRNRVYLAQLTSL
jgi:hypothetical protein